MLTLANRLNTSYIFATGAGMLIYALIAFIALSALTQGGVSAKDCEDKVTPVCQNCFKDLEKYREEDIFGREDSSQALPSRSKRPPQKPGIKSAHR
ncbi:hypothetical protein GCK32_016701 [Trichostrongylus colubriformis]|uniref:Uncharacterized protein n=1 Tax=Trichostrongylus colubriformis TaxID=6319 RepID=A0AAN8FQJ8_TRICO